MEVLWRDLALLLLLTLELMLGFSQLSFGGITSNYVRTANLSLDMPLDADVFSVPPGYNAPQQVLSPYKSIILFETGIV